MRLRRKNSPQVKKLEQSLKLREREYENVLKEKRKYIEKKYKQKDVTV